MVKLSFRRLESEQPPPQRGHIENRTWPCSLQDDPAVGASPHQVEVAGGALEKPASDGVFACESQRRVARALAMRAARKVELNPITFEHSEAPVNAREA